jgi:putative oxygen-independent coproporphyrinogen III oxidase
MNNNIPLSLYIHFPWCVRKCPYCDFNSHALKDNLPEEEYIKKLLEDFDQEIPSVQDRKIRSIFMGGGTPSLFSPQSIELLLTYIKNKMAFESPGSEITLEANPGTVEQEKFSGFLKAGINRLSIGIQSFNDNKLKTLGRIHNGNTAYKAVENAKKSGFTNFNLDLMHGLPDQTLEEALEDISIALQFSPPHLSWYQLTLEPNTLFYQKPPQLPHENILNNIYEEGQKLFKKNNYTHYEVSAYCKNNLQSQHNINYWEFGDYIGIGAGAHGKITDFNSQEIIRYTKSKHPKEYLNANHFRTTQHIVEPKQVPFEFMLNALRLHKPISWQLFSERTFLEKENILSVIEKLKEKNLIIYNKDTLELTDLGHRFLNDVLTEFM